MERVVITGMGVVSPVGNDLDTFWNNLIAGKSGISEIDTMDTSKHKVKFGGVVRDFDSEALLGRKAARHMDKFAQFALVAAQQAWDQSGLTSDNIDSARLGAYVGSGIGGFETLFQNFLKLQEKGPRRVSPTLVPSMMANAASAQITIRFGAMGPSMSPVSACATGNHSIGEAFRLIRSGEADAMFAGGTESTINDISLASFGNARALSTRNDDPQGASRPFDVDRDGFVIAEGAGILILESLSHAKARGANILAEMVGYGASSDAYHMVATHPEGEGAYLAMKAAFRSANLDPSEVDVVNAHATSTPVGDVSETKALKQLLGDHAYNLPITANKSMFGHMLGAAGGAEAISLAMSIQNDIVPPTINLENQDPECDLDYVANEARELPLRVGISNSFGFGGHNAALIFKKYEDD
ncbi:beta-ketoacyl-ACP synthase II [Staphylococcus pettenkoferi]|uniref:beta-ketoacyl-ACP synthase II n=1 Tax=Staphylococcus pettenkoferi TaxID=170573 RepID=UPI002276D2DD|nr:beta-ketoacyl-ACP synthase II [Staphylococcus pettenkoferi]MCY1574350.1 beta-ketoacyl-ACP synthase II [Staphylococcus pettenkoferi]MCY1577499.1 beta-ketoacyl-ACP synthase II [Staphylococcus pettenkoferi]